MFCLSAIAGFSQEKLSPKELFEEGQYFFEREDYKEAAYFYTKLVEKIPDNANYNFKAGECYLKIPGQEHLAVSFFEKAAKKVIAKNDYKENDFSEYNAPLHALFYLGNAYRISGKLDDALKTYEKFIDSPYFYHSYNINFVEQEINSCERAKIIQDVPIDLIKTKVNNKINTNYSEFNPVVSADENTLIFNRGLKFYDAIFMSKKIDGDWATPVNINEEVVSDGDFYPTALNSNGTILLLTREENQNADIYISYYRNNKWTKAEKIPGKINTYVQETYATFGTDDNTIYLVSDRQGSVGGKDIFVSKLDSKGNWGKPKNIGSIVNTSEDEETPVICNSGNTLFFSSKSHYNMGGFDIFYSYFENNKWSTPRNVGYSLSTTRDDLFYIVNKGCMTGFYSIIDTETGFADIYEIETKTFLAVP